MGCFVEFFIDSAPQETAFQPQGRFSELSGDLFLHLLTSGLYMMSPCPWFSLHLLFKTGAYLRRPLIGLNHDK